MGAREELWALYTAESSLEVKKRILQSLFVSGAVDKLAELARTEKDPSLRKSAIHSLGISGKRTAADLLQIYNSDTDREVRKEVLHALFIQNNATALIEIARKEKDPELKKQAVHSISLTNSPEARKYLMELLNP
jgi:HEAT repeat protein